MARIIILALTVLLLIPPTPTGRFRLYRVDATYYRVRQCPGVTYVCEDWYPMGTTYQRQWVIR